MRSERSFLQMNMNPVVLAYKFLCRPIRATLIFRGAHFLSRLPFLPAASRRSFLRSAAKRDGKWLARELLDIKTAAWSGADPSNPDNVFRDHDRQGVAGSDWHLGLLKALEGGEAAPGALPAISVSFVTHDSAGWLPGLFQSLLEQGYPLSRLNLFFVDHDSHDDTVAMIERFKREHGASFSSLTIHRQDNLGFGMGHDYTFRNSRDAFVLVSNVDLIFHAHSILGAVRVAQHDAEAVASWELRQCPFEHPKYYDPVTLETFWSSYACILVRRSAYLKVGGFEERIFMYGEDVELSYRLRGAGYRLRYLPRAAVTHFVEFNDTKLRPLQFGGSIAANLLLRHRYGDAQCAQEGMRLLRTAIGVERNEDRRAALEQAHAQVLRDRRHFELDRRPKIEAGFPFNGFDYDITRLGHDTPLDSSKPLDGPLVSIITRTYGPKTGLLREAIASVCNQSYPHIEHVIVEDRTEEAEALTAHLREVYARDIRYVRSPGVGRSSAGNFGLAQARGAFLMFLDNDDLLFADHVEILVRALLACPQAPAAFSLGWEMPTFYDQNGGYRDGVPFHVPTHAAEFTLGRLEEGNFMPIQNVLFRRELFERYGGFDPDIDLMEDWNLWCRYSQAGMFQYVPKTTAIYRVPGDPVFRNLRSRALRAAETVVRAKNARYFPPSRSFSLTRSRPSPGSTNSR